MRPPALWVLLVVLVAGCGRSSRDARQRQRLLELIDTLPRLEAEQRAWPRSATLACDERTLARVHEIDALRAQLEDVMASLPARRELGSVLQACDELEGCARCDEGFAARCARTRELLVEVQLALAKTGLR